MIQAAEFVEAARARGFSLYTGVPCSYLKPFINYVIDDPELDYVSSANEGDAVATATGAVLGGRRAIAMMQNSGLGNAVSPLTSLNFVFRLPVLLIVTWRGDPEHKDEPQHALMGQVTAAMLEVMRIPWEYFPERAEDVAPALDRALAYMTAEARPYCLIMRKDTVAAHALVNTRPPQAPASDRLLAGVAPGEPRISRKQALSAIVDETPVEDTVVIGSTGFNGRELFAIADRPNHFYMVGSMGCASSMGLGLALARPDLRVVVADGDGAALMRMGNLATIGSYAAGNFVHVLLDNGVHDSTGGQSTVANNVDFARIAQACHYALSLQGGDETSIRELFAAGCDGARFLHLPTLPGAAKDLPRPDVTPEQVCRRLAAHIGAGVAGA